MMRLWQIPFSTNVERVALALAYKGLEAEPVLVDPEDRSALLELSGQPLVPVLEDGERVVADSPGILAYLEELVPDPSLLPSDPGVRAEMERFCAWFNGTWKRWPNRIAAGAGEPGDAAALRDSLDRVDAMLERGPYLFGHELSLADVTAFPFLKYGWVHDPEDDEPFHEVLASHLALDPRHARLRSWVERMDRLPRAGMAATAGPSLR